MSQRIAVIDYGMGNLRSVCKAIEHVGGRDVSVHLADTPDAVSGADRVVFPGQGAMGDCMSALERLDLVDIITTSLRTRPFLGICVGFQALFDESEEDGGTPGLGLLGGRVERFASGMRDERHGSRLKVPHMGWSQVSRARDHALWDGIEDGSRFYFVHSYHVQPADASTSVGQCHYGVPFCAAGGGENWFATQFHPEKSAADGLRLIENFVRWNP